MSNAAFTIHAQAAEASQARALYQAAFPEENLLDLVDDLRSAPRAQAFSARDGHLNIGEIWLTEGAVRTGAAEVGAAASCALLGPLAVLPHYQRKGIGSTLVRTCLERCRADGKSKLLVLGDPNYYGRLGFRGEQWVAPPYQLPAAFRQAWQSINLTASNELEGDLTLPEVWMKRSLWVP